MRRMKYWIIGFVVISLMGCAMAEYTAKYGEYLDKLPKPPTGKGIIWIVRPNLLVGPEGIPYDLFINGRHIGMLTPFSYMYQVVEPGKHSISFTGRDTLFIPKTVNIKPDETLYLKMKCPSFFSSLIKVIIEPCSQEQVKEYIKKYPRLPQLDE